MGAWGISAYLLVSELGRLHGVNRHVLHLDGALTGPGSILGALLTGGVFDEGWRPGLLWHCLGLCCLQLAAHHQVQSRSCLLHGLLNLLLVRLLEVALYPYTESAALW